MDMKLNTHRIKTLRFNLSWSQEKLAEKAGLNPRTIQRVEADGSASLHTRLCLARALGVEPQELDSVEPLATQVAGDSSKAAATSVSRHHPGSIYQLPLLLLISLVYLAWTPIYFSLSSSNLARLFTQLVVVPTTTWMAITATLWLALSLPWMGLVYYRYRQHLRLHMACLATLVCCTGLRVLQEEFMMHALSFALYLSGLALLYTCYRSTAHQARIRQVFFICLAAYLFVWLLQDRVSTFMFAAYFRWQQDMGIPLPWVSFPRYVLRVLGQTTQLFPMALILLFDLGRARMSSSGPKPDLVDGDLAFARAS
jgi:transcriptional regulator with XRE-family HTH domain